MRWAAQADKEENNGCQGWLFILTKPNSRPPFLSDPNYHLTQAPRCDVTMKRFTLQHSVSSSVQVIACSLFYSQKLNTWHSVNVSFQSCEMFRMVLTWFPYAHEITLKTLKKKKNYISGNKSNNVIWERLLLVMSPEFSPCQFRSAVVFSVLGNGVGFMRCNITISVQCLSPAVFRALMDDSVHFLLGTTQTQLATRVVNMVEHFLL